MQRTYLRATVTTLIGLLATGTIVAGAAVPITVRSAADITSKLRLERRAPLFQGQVCQIGSKNCTEMSRDPPRPCLLSPQLCAMRGMKFVPL
jgi:hypothetical protein